MARIPDSTAVSGAPSLRPSGAIAVADMSPIARGAQNFAAGIGDAAGSLYAYAKKEEAKENVVDVAAADAAMRKRFMEIQAEFESDNDYATFDKRSNAMTTAAKDDAAKLIRNEETRQAWLGQAELSRLTQVEAVNSRGRQLKSDLDLAKLDDANKVLFDTIADPNTDPVEAVRSTNTILANIDSAVATGIMTPAMAVERRRVIAAGAQKQRAANEAFMLADADPAAAIARFGVSEKPGDVSAAMAAASNGQPIPLPADVATVIAKQLGDESFPKDPADIEAFLSDTETNQKYVAEAIKTMQNKLGGDLEAAVIALAPGGSVELARKYQETGDEADLPPAVADFFFATMNSVAPASGGTVLPLEFDSEIDVASLNVNDLDAWEKAQAMFGQTVRVVSGVTNKENDAAGGRPGLNLDISKLDEKQRERLMLVASASGFSKIGIYKGAMHLEVGDGEPEVWGPAGGNVPAWASDLATKHMAGVIPPPTAYNGRDPQFAAANYSDLLAAKRQAQDNLNQQKLEARAWISTAVENLPSAIANGIPYEGKIPTATDFVNSYGPVEGISRWNAFEAQRDLATDIVAMGSMPNDMLLDITKTAADDIRNAPSDQIAMTEKASAAKVEAATAVLAAREKDPAAATLQAFPDIKTLWDAAAEDPSQMPGAVKAMYTAQAMLGIAPDKMRVLPQPVATAAVTTFKDINIPEGQRQDGILATVALAGGDEVMQDAIVAQLIIDGGAPRQMKAALAPLERDERGNEATARSLLSAMMATEEALGLKGTGDQNIKTGIVNRVEVLAEDNGLADVMYGLGYGVDNAERWNDDKDLLMRATALHMLGGRMSEEDAFKLALKDMYGDVKPASGRNVNAIIDATDDADLLMDGFERAMVPAKAVLKLELTEGFNASYPDVKNNKFVEYAIGRSIEETIETGYWANGPEKDTFVFVHGPTGQMLPDPEKPGSPYMMTKADIERMGRNARAQGRSSAAGPTFGGNTYGDGAPLQFPTGEN